MGGECLKCTRNGKELGHKQLGHVDYLCCWNGDGSAGDLPIISLFCNRYFEQSVFRTIPKFSKTFSGISLNQFLIPLERYISSF